MDGVDETESQGSCSDARPHAPLHGVRVVPRLYISPAFISKLVFLCRPLLFLWVHRFAHGPKEENRGRYSSARLREAKAFSGPCSTSARLHLSARPSGVSPNRRTSNKAYLGNRVELFMGLLLKLGVLPRSKEKRGRIASECHLSFPHSVFDEMAEPCHCLVNAGNRCEISPQTTRTISRHIRTWRDLI